MKYAVIAPMLFDGLSSTATQALLINGQHVEKIVSSADVPHGYETVQLTHGMLAPGLLDLQVNGGGGVLFNNQPSPEGLFQMADAHAAAGVARIMPTVITDDPQITRKAVIAARKAHVDLYQGLLGIHIEGPFFNTERNGVHSEKHLRQFAANDWAWIEEASWMPCIITLAPEQVPVSIIRRMVDIGIRVSAGHTNSTFDEVRTAMNAGLSGVTHLYNAMSPLISREPGAVGAGLTLDPLWCWVIADGHHVHPQALHLARRAKPTGKLILVSDAMATIGMSTEQGPPAFTLYNERIEVANGRLINSQGRLAGSAISLADAVRYVVETLGWPKTEAIAMASLYPAEFLGVDDQFGSLRPGRIADLTWFDDAMNVVGLWRAGQRLK